MVILNRVNIAPVTIISSLFPPDHGGVADHTLLLARHLGERLPVKVLTSARNEGRDLTRISGTIRNWASSTELIKAVQNLSSVGPILWQYVPHMYGRGGVNLGLPRAMAELRRGGRRQFVIAHEIAAPWSVWPHRMLYAVAHRWQWRSIMQTADRLGISSEAWLVNYSRQFPRWAGKLQLLPSPSTIPVLQLNDSEKARWCADHDIDPSAKWLLFFGTISSSKQLDWVRMTWKKTQPSKNRVGLLIVGERVNWPVPPSEKAWLRTPGFLPPNQVSIAFQTSDLALLPFIDGASERRTSFMAALSHGLPVLTTAGPSTGPTLRAASGFSICATVDAFVQATARLLADEPVRSRLGSAGRALYEANYSWTRLVEQLAPQLTLPLQNRQRSP